MNWIFTCEVRRHAIHRSASSCQQSVLVALSCMIVPLRVYAACTAADIMSAEGSGNCPGSGTCTITQTHSISNECTLDFDGRPVVINPGGRLTGGSFTLRAGALTLRATSAGRGRIDGADVDLRLEISGPVWLQRYNTNRGTIEVTTNTAGSITIEADALNVLGTLGTVAGGPTANGGDLIVATAGDIVVDAGALLRGTGGANGAMGGRVNLSAGGALTLGSVVDVTGGWGGEVALFAEGAVAVAAGCDAHARDSTNGGDGGVVTIEAGGGVSVAGTLNVNANGAGAYSGEGGAIDITSETGPLTISGPINGNGAAGGSGAYVLLLGARRKYLHR